MVAVLTPRLQALHQAHHQDHPLQREDAHGVEALVLSHLKVLVVICLHGWHIQTEKEINVHIATDIILIYIHDVHHVMCPDNTRPTFLNEYFVTTKPTEDAVYDKYKYLLQSPLFNPPSFVIF